MKNRTKFCLLWSSCKSRMYLTLRQNFDVSFDQNVKISYVKFLRMFLQSVKCLCYDMLCYVRMELA